LETLKGNTAKQHRLDLSPIIYSDELIRSKQQTCQIERNNPFDQGVLAAKMVKDILPTIEKKSAGVFEYKVTNCDRSIGARLSGEIAQRHGDSGMSKTPIRLNLVGVAGQSLGVWNAGGLHIYLEGDANDYVGKGMAGGKIVIRPPKKSEFSSKKTSIIGNTCLYGATGGQLLASGQAGERCAVRNSGAHVVVEGAGDHCCEYMTGGVVTVLGECGVNFGAGMTGGIAYVLDESNTFADKLNGDSVDICRITSEAFAEYEQHLRGIISQFAKETGSLWGKELSENFSAWHGKFWLVKPKAAELDSLLANLKSRSE